MSDAIGAAVRVLHLCPDAHYLRDLFWLYHTALDEPPFESTLLFLRGQPDAQTAAAFGERAVFLDLPRRKLAGARLGALWRLWRWSRRQPRFDVVIAHRFKPLTLAIALRRLGAVRAVFGVVHEIGQFQGRRRRLIERAAALPLTLLGVSEAVRVDLLERFPRLPPEHVKALPNAVRPSPPIDRDAALATLGLSPQWFWFGAVGRLVPRKGYDVLLRAFAPLARQYPTLGLALIGSGSEEHALRALCRELGIVDRVTLCGWRDDARCLIGAFDVCVVPSRKEPFGLVNAEAMAAGRPVIASAVGGVPEVLGDCAVLVPPDDVPALTEALRRLHDDADLRANMGAALHARWQAQFAPEQFTRRLQGYVRDALGLAP